MYCDIHTNLVFSSSTYCNNLSRTFFFLKRTLPYFTEFFTYFLSLHKTYCRTTGDSWHSHSFLWIWFNLHEFFLFTHMLLIFTQYRSHRRTSLNLTHFSSISFDKKIVFFLNSNFSVAAAPLIILFVYFATLAPAVLKFDKLRLITTSTV